VLPDELVLPPEVLPDELVLPPLDDPVCGGAGGPSRGGSGPTLSAVGGPKRSPFSALGCSNAPLEL
jgi:hypothetical protein